MKCLACDRVLSDREASRVYVSSGEHVDLCEDCYEPVAGEIDSKVNNFLKNQPFEETIYTPRKKRPVEEDQAEEE